MATDVTLEDLRQILDAYDKSSRKDREQAGDDLANAVSDYLDSAAGGGS